MDFPEIRLDKCRPNKDFGKGFYLTRLKKQAMEMAIRRCEFEQTGTPVVQTYEFDERILTSGELNVRTFEKPTREWAEFILLNRKARGRKMHNFDIVTGPVADDGVVYQLNLYQQRIITLEQLVKELTYAKLNNQYLFATERAISKLRRL